MLCTLPVDELSMSPSLILTLSDTRTTALTLVSSTSDDIPIFLYSSPTNSQGVLCQSDISKFEPEDFNELHLPVIHSNEAAAHNTAPECDNGGEQSHTRCSDLFYYPDRHGNNVYERRIMDSLQPSYNATICHYSQDSPFSANSTMIFASASSISGQNDIYSRSQAERQCDVQGLGEDLSTTDISSTINSPSNLDHYDWLKDIFIEIWIDQEGFRAVRPQFKLHTFLHNQEELSNAQSKAAIAVFRPIKREVFFFHHGTFEFSPSLRRVTVGGGGSVDHISRQATLCIKKNGVYFVSGTEVNKSDKLSSNAAVFELKWKLEYVVDDRRASPSGKILNGEKTLCLLSFSCSPELLKASNGRKVKLLHVMKKTLVPNLISERLEPPLPSNSVLLKLLKHNDSSSEHLSKATKASSELYLSVRSKEKSQGDRSCHRRASSTSTCGHSESLLSGLIINHSMMLRPIITPSELLQLFETEIGRGNILHSDRTFSFRPAPRGRK